MLSNLNSTHFGQFLVFYIFLFLVFFNRDFEWYFRLENKMLGQPRPILYDFCDFL